MKKRLLLLCAALCALHVFAQNINLKGKGGISNQFTQVNENVKINFLSSNLKELLQLNPNSNLVLVKTEDDRLGFIHYRYYQTYSNIPVEKTMLKVHTQNGFLKNISGTIVTDFDATMDKRNHASVSAAQSVSIAIRHVAAKKYAWQDAGMEQRIKEQFKNAKATFYPTAQLVWYNPGESLNPRELTLCYKVDVYALQPLSRANYFIDAQTGKVTGKEDEIYFSDATGTANTAWSGTQTIHSDFTGTQYRLRDLTKGNGVITVHGESGKRGQDYTSTSANWSLTSFDQAAMDAHYGVEQTYSYYKVNFGRNSYDDNGTTLYSYVNDPTYIDNAFWDGSAMNFNKRSTGEPGGVTGIDVTGHELTHGVTQESCALEYSYESGAINESLSDIMGKSVQFWAKPTDVNWLLSNDMNWIIRDMSNPNTEFQPDTYKGTYWYTGFFDNGGVHTNSGVGNFMFYLLVNGGSGTNDNGDAYTVSAIGLTKTDQIIYRSQTVYLTSTSKYADWRNACILGAADLYGAASTEVAAVKDAFYAVGIGTSSAGCDAPFGLSVTNTTHTSATVSWAPSIGVTGYNMQWKLTTSTAWRTVSNITATSYKLTGLLPGVSYDFKVQSICTSGATSGYSDVYTFTTNALVSYCASAGLSTSYEYIDRVALGGKGYSSGDNGGYGNFINLGGAVQKNISLSLILTPGFANATYAEYWTAYIDYNQDGDFADANELIGTATSVSAAPATIQFTVPASAKNGITRVRVQMSYGSQTTDPCATFSFGEVEDYTIKISTAAENSIADANKETSGASFISVKPNPIKGSSATAELNALKGGNVTIRITDLSGRPLLLQQVANIVAGKNTFTLNGLDKLTHGVFMIEAEQNNIVIARSQLIADK